jgi:hypothetical protein
MSTAAEDRTDRVAAWTTALGIGLIVFMLTWTIGARITERIFDAPDHAVIAMSIALLSGATTTVRAGHRLHGRLQDAQLVTPGPPTGPGH